MDHYVWIFLVFILAIALGLFLKPVIEKFAVASPLIDCSTNKDCSTCSNTQGCGWCKSSNSCVMVDRFNVPYGKSCEVEGIVELASLCPPVVIAMNDPMIKERPANPMNNVPQTINANVVARKTVEPMDDMVSTAMDKLSSIFSTTSEVEPTISGYTDTMTDIEEVDSNVKGFDDVVQKELIRNGLVVKEGFEQIPAVQDGKEQEDVAMMIKNALEKKSNKFID
jgi:hypothetical protein